MNKHSNPISVIVAQAQYFGNTTKVIQDILGHVDVSTTMNIYVDAMNDMKKKEMSAYSNYISQSGDADIALQGKATE